MTPPSRLSFAKTDARVPALALGTLLLIDLLRVWLPSIITIFGQAASTPAELMGGFALCWFVAGFAAVPLAVRWDARRVALGGAAGLAVARYALVFTHGGQPQLSIACVGLLAGLGWLAATAVRGGPAALGVPVGLAAAALQHAALSTVDLTWQSRWLAGPLVLLEALVFVLCQRRAAPGRSSVAVWLLFGPAMLLAGMFAMSPALADVIVSYDTKPYGSTAAMFLPQLLLGLAVTVFLSGALGPLGGRVSRIVTAAGMLITAGLIGWTGSLGLLFAMLGGALALGQAFRAAGGFQDTTGARAGYAAIGGTVLFAVAAVAFYAAYDIGYPNQWVPLAVALVPAGVLLRLGRPVPAVALPWQPTVAVVMLCLLVPLLGVTTPPRAAAAGGANGELRLVEYNIRMGFGLDGTYRPRAVAEIIAAQHPDVVVLSEVDRGWLLNGGHDDLQVLARELGMRYWFGPAADLLWGDAVLTNLPVVAAETVPLPSVGAPTGAQALGVVVRAGGREIAVVSTHIQPPPGAQPTVQAQRIAEFATRFGAGRPTLIAGDLNIEPGDAAMATFAGAGYADGFAASRPVRTFPADAPVQQIDHVLVRGLTCGEVTVGRATTSDHAPVFTVVR